MYQKIKNIFETEPLIIGKHYRYNFFLGREINFLSNTLRQKIKNKCEAKGFQVLSIDLVNDKRITMIGKYTGQSNLTVMSPVLAIAIIIIVGLVLLLALTVIVVTNIEEIKPMAVTGFVWLTVATIFIAIVWGYNKWKG